MNVVTWALSERGASWDPRATLTNTASEDLASSAADDAAHEHPHARPDPTAVIAAAISRMAPS